MFMLFYNEIWGFVHNVLACTKRGISTDHTASCGAEDLARSDRGWTSRDAWHNPQPTAAMTTRCKHWSDGIFPETLTDKNGTEQVPVLFNI